MELACWVDKWGRTVVLTDDRWHGHVLRRHLELAGQDAAIGAVLTDPDLLMAHERTLARECYYRAGALSTLSPTLLLKVVVQFLTPDYRTSYVVTVLPTARVKSQERMLWTR